MEKTGQKYKLTSLTDVQQTGRDTLHEKLGLTGAEISFNALPAGVSVPFVHAHKENEEIYVILEGKGQVFIDGEEFDIEKGNVIRIDPAAARCFKADSENAITFLCVQAKAGSLTQFTENDGFPVEQKPSWLN
jgi:uncharacterized cupin superfamily protein